MMLERGIGRTQFLVLTHTIAKYGGFDQSKLPTVVLVRYSENEHLMVLASGQHRAAAILTLHLAALDEDLSGKLTETWVNLGLCEENEAESLLESFAEKHPSTVVNLKLLPEELDLDAQALRLLRVKSSDDQVGCF